MKKYSKVAVTLVVMVLVTSIGFGTAFGYGGRRITKPVITLAPIVDATGQVLGASTMSSSVFVSKLVQLGIISKDKLDFINLLISLGIIK